MKHFLKPWVFVLTGVVFNISAAVITHYFIGLNNSRIAEIDRMIEGRQIFIDGMWQSRIESERNKEFFILYYGDDRDGDSRDQELIDNYYQQTLRELAQAYELKELEDQITRHRPGDIEFLLDFSRQLRSFTIETINDSYLEKLDLEDSKIPIERGNSRLLSIAIFLQVIGLILILARDLRRS